MTRGFLKGFAERLRRIAHPPVPGVAASVDFEDMLAAFYARLDLQGAEVVDIGAHTGKHAIPLSRQIGMTGTCHAFEPIPQIRGALVRRIAAEGLNNVVVYPFALADKPGVCEFMYLPARPEESGLKRRHRYHAGPSPVEKIGVKVCRLDDVLPAGARIRFIKMDVEGGERDVLRGALGILEGSRPIVAFECGADAFLGYHESSDEIFEIFHSRSYSVYSISGLHMAGAEQFRAAAFRQDFWDYVAFPDPQARLHELLARA